MDQPDAAGFFGHGSYPVQKPAPIGMSRVTGQVVHLRPDENALPIKLHITPRAFGVLDDIPSRGAFGLVADKNDIVPRILKSGLEMVDDPSTGAHAAPRKDDRRAGHLEQAEMVFVAGHRIKPVKVQWVVAATQKLLRFRIPVGLERRMDAGEFETERGIDTDRKLAGLKCGKSALQLRVGKEPVYFVKEFLGAPKGEGRNENLPAVGQSPGEDLTQAPRSVSSFLVQPVPISGFQDEEVARAR